MCCFKSAVKLPAVAHHLLSLRRSFLLRVFGVLLELALEIESSTSTNESVSAYSCFVPISGLMLKNELSGAAMDPPRPLDVDNGHDLFDILGYDLRFLPHLGVLRGRLRDPRRHHAHGVRCHNRDLADPALSVVAGERALAVPLRR